MKLRNQSLETSILWAIYTAVFFFFSFQDALFSPDTYSYLSAMPWRTSGYVIFIKIFEFVFPQNYAQMVVVAQLVICLFAVHYFYKSMSRLLSLNQISKALLLVVLLVPFFSPLLVANNLSSEGLAYPLYLLFIAQGFEMLFAQKKYAFLFMLLIYTMLVLTRAQFIISTGVFAFVYLFKYRTFYTDKNHVLKFLLLLLIPILILFLDKSYHQLKDGVFMSTPYSYVNSSGAAFFVSNASDAVVIENPEVKALFEECHKDLKAAKLLLSSKLSAAENYQVYHDHVPQICNAIVHNTMRDYYYNQYLIQYDDKKAASVYSLQQAELASKSIFYTLVTHNFSKWFQLYLSNIVHGFKSVVLLILIILIFLFSGFKVIFKPSQSFTILFILSALTLSNAMIVSFASHSIMRYLFYNYVLVLLIGITIFKLINNVKRS